MKNLKLGTIVVTRGIDVETETNEQFERFVNKSFKRYLSMDWEELCEEDKKLNDDAVRYGNDRIVAKYKCNIYEDCDDFDIYIITECDRSATTILFTYEY